MVDSLIHSELAGIVLAAGGSSRLGSAKQLLRWNDQTFVSRAVANARTVCGAGVVLVTGAEADAVERAVREHTAAGVVIAQNEAWERGLGASLAVGAGALGSSSATGVLVLLCDQPLLTVDNLVSLVRVWQNSPSQPAASAYGDSVGVPAVFPSSWLPRLKQLDGDRGAQSLFASSDTQTLAMPNAERDIDTPDDWRALQQQQ